MKIIGNKKQHQLALQIVANYLIGKDALNRANTDGSLSVEQWDDAITHLTQNTIELLTAIVGVNGLKYYTNKYGLGVSKL